ncbi:MAG: SRPBCC family protein [Sphingomonadales bacterium]|nr:SRPBCC family protein [Sphingomonadales bacterium]
MKFSSREDIAAPAEFVFDQLADFSAFEEMAVARGVEIRRKDSRTSPGRGLKWEIAFSFRGKARKIDAEVTRYDRPDRLEYQGQSPSFELVMEVSLVALTRARTRMQMGLEVKPRTLGARLMVQSAKLGRSKLDARFAKRIAGFARLIEARHLTQA